MKKQIIIVLLFSFHASAQNAKFPKLKISAPCDQEFLDHYKGKWLIPTKTLVNSPNKDYSKGAIERIIEIHELVKQTYPEPVGSDAIWNALYVKDYFGSTIKYVTEDNSARMEYVRINQVEGWKYNTILCAWFCSEIPSQIWNGYPDAGGGNGITVDANRLSVLNGEFMDDDVWTIQGRPIKTKMPVIGKWKGYDVMATNGGYYVDQNNEWFILIARKDMLPYIPVTRKQYLDRAIAYIAKFYDKMIAFNEQIPDQTERDENKKRNIKEKDIAVKNLQRELEKTTKDSLLGAPAVVRRDAYFQTEGPIFLSESDGGVLLATENPDYFRKDLPANIPQLFVLSWTWGTKKWETNFRKAIEENFPIEKLQAMIDK